MAVAGLVRASFAAPAVLVLAIGIFPIDLLAPALRLPAWVEQLALTTHLGEPVIGRWDAPGLAARWCSLSVGSPSERGACPDATSGLTEGRRHRRCGNGRRLRFGASRAIEVTLRTSGTVKYRGHHWIHDVSANGAAGEADDDVSGVGVTQCCGAALHRTDVAPHNLASSRLSSVIDCPRID